MKLYVMKSPASKMSPRYTAITYDSTINKITYIQKSKFFEIPTDHEIFQTNPDFVQEIPENLLVHNGVRYSEGFLQTIDINELKNSYQWADRSSYAILFDATMKEYKELFHLEFETYSSRQTLKSYIEQENKWISSMLLVPYATGEDMSIFLARSDHEQDVLITHGDIEVVEIPSDLTNAYSYLKNLLFPIITSNHPLIMTKDSSETVSIVLRRKDGEPITDRNATVYLEPVIGTINKTRIDLVNGTGSFTVSSTGLSAGDIIRIKVGWKWWKGEHDIFITVTD